MVQRPWHKVYPRQVPAEIDFEKITVSQMLARTANRFSDHVALTYEGADITYHHLNHLVNRFSRALIALGLKKGQRVAVLLPNIPQTVIACQAVLRIGAVTDMKIVDTTDGISEMPSGEPGEIIVNGPQIMKGYLNRPDETDNVIKKGWLYTGDIGCMDDDGYLTIVDRKKDVIVASGFNVYPKEIDELLFAHPKVMEACTIGVPHEYRGETVKSYVVLKKGITLAEEEIVDYCRQHLAPYKVPRMIEFVDSLPKSAIGKILRKDLREKEKQHG